MLPPRFVLTRPALVQLVFGARIKAYHVWQAAELSLRKAKANHDKAKKSGRAHSELLGLSVSEISEVSRATRQSLLQHLPFHLLPLSPTCVPHVARSVFSSLGCHRATRVCTTIH